MGDRRRQRIVDMLRDSARPITGAELATRTGVSRQVIVQDMALLRALGEEVIATPQGYLLAARLGSAAQRTVLACCHGREETEDELATLVDLGVKVIDVIVEHPIYGEMRAMLALESLDDVRHFMERLRESGATLLSALTNGVHLHTVEGSRPEMLDRAREALQAKGYLLSASDENEA